MRGEKKHRLTHWTYLFSSDEENVPVCKKFFCGFLSLGKKRVETVQKKILNKMPLTNLAGGRRENRVKLSEDLKKMIGEHCELIPHRTSHYKR